MNTRVPPIELVRDLLRLAARYVVAGALFHSGMRLVVNLGGIHPGPVEWVTPLGEISGAQFAGVWLGSTPIFQTLGGLVQVAGGLLLLSRKTTTLGAIIAAGCLSNSMMLDLCFRPSPWIGDASLFVLSLYLVAMDWRVLVNLLLLNRPTTPISIKPSWETPDLRKIGLALKTVVLIYFVYVNGFRIVRIKQDADARSALSGAWSVASFSPANASLQNRWRIVAIDRYAERFTVRTANGAGMTFQIQADLPHRASSNQSGSYRERVAATATPSGRITLVAPGGSISVLNYFHPTAAHLVLEGKLDGVATMADLRLIPPAGLPLLNKQIYFPEPR